MKKFEMPVVVLNEMTMNESIAADCCYSVKTEGLVTTKSILSGGDIANYVTWPLKSVVLEAFGTRANIPLYHSTLYVPNTKTAAYDQNGLLASYSKYDSYSVVNYSSNGSEVTWVRLFSTDVFGTGNYTGTPPSGSYITHGAKCDHLGECAFTEKDTVTNAHIGSTVKHLFGGADWASPHTAQQYNS